MLPPVLVGFLFLVAVLGALGVMAYIAWKGSKPTDFFAEAIEDEYSLELAQAEIDAFYDLKDELQTEFAPESIDAPPPVEDDDDEEGAEPEPSWVQKVPADRKNDLKKALVRRLLACISKLEQIQRDKPGQWKLWQSKLVSERRWSSVVNAETMVSQEIDGCIAEAEEIEPGWKDSIFGEALHLYRLQKQHAAQKVAEKQEKVDEKKAIKKTVKQIETEKRMEIENKVKQEEEKVKQLERNKKREIEERVAQEKAKELERKKRKEVEEKVAKQLEINKRKEIEERAAQERAAQKAMEQLLAEEEKAAKAEKKAGKKGGVAPTSAGKAKGKKK